MQHDTIKPLNTKGEYRVHPQHYNIVHNPQKHETFGEGSIIFLELLYAVQRMMLSLLSSVKKLTASLRVMEEGHKGCFLVLTIMNNATMNLVKYVSEISDLSKTFIVKEYWILSKVFSVSIEMIMKVHPLDSQRPCACVWRQGLYKGLYSFIASDFSSSKRQK
ncbi:hypothetical protein STEG23_036565, partial [Scotinomys teguina]